MGHIANYFVFDSKKDVLPGANDFAFYNTDRQENPSGSYHGNLTFHDVVCDCFEDAIEKINKWGRGHYSDHAVRFKSFESLPKSKKIQTLEERMKKNRRDKEEYSKKHNVGQLKAKLLTCTKCESKVAKDYLNGSNRCPVCGTDLRAEYILDRLKKYDNDYRELEKLRKGEEKKLQQKMQKKAKIKWVAKFEVHC